MADEKIVWRREVLDLANEIEAARAVDPMTALELAIASLCQPKQFINSSGTLPSERAVERA